MYVYTVVQLNGCKDYMVVQLYVCIVAWLHVCRVVWLCVGITNVTFIVTLCRDTFVRSVVW